MRDVKKKLLILSGDFCLEAGGIQNTSFLFAKYFREYFDVYTFCTKGGNVPVLEGVSTFTSDYSRVNPLGVIQFYKQALQIKKSEGLDYILAVHFGYAIVCVLLKWFCHIPYGTLAHGEEVVKWPKKGLFQTIVWYILYYPLRWLIYKNANDIFANTNFTRGLVEKITANRKITVINPPIGTMPSETEANQTKTSFLLSVGRLEDRKGYQNVIKALPIVLREKPDLQYFIAGGGDYRKDIENIAVQEGVSDHVKFLGRISEEYKCKLLSECSLFVMPSCKIKGKSSVEGFGLSLLEANSYGKFVISTYSGGIPEAVIKDKTGFLVEENNVEQLAEAILKFYSDSFNYDISDCIEWASKRFIPNIVHQYKVQIERTINQ